VYTASESFVVVVPVVYKTACVLVRVYGRLSREYCGMLRRNPPWCMWTAEACGRAQHVRSCAPGPARDGRALVLR
jgi:hypothetical protein